MKKLLVLLPLIALIVGAYLTHKEFQVLKAAQARRISTYGYAAMFGCTDAALHITARMIYLNKKTEPLAHKIQAEMLEHCSKSSDQFKRFMTR